MKIFVKVKPNAKRGCVAQLDAAHFEISVTEPARQGKANHAVMRALAEHVRAPLSRVRLVSGAASRNKIFEIQA